MIGILAGMGPKSTAPFLEKVVEMCQERHGAKYDIDFPPMMIYSCPTPFYLDRPLDHPAMENAIVAGAKKLALTGVEYIAIPCNVAHLYFTAVQKAISVPVLNMVELTLQSIPIDYKKVTVLATPSTMSSKIYQNGLMKFDKEFIFEPRWQETVNTVLSIIKGGTNIEKARYLWNDLLRDLEKTVPVAIIACTDLNIVADQLSSRILLVDSAACLAQATVDKYYSETKI